MDDFLNVPWWVMLILAAIWIGGAMMLRDIDRMQGKASKTACTQFNQVR